jgi:hypothetical protein
MGLLSRLASWLLLITLAVQAPFPRLFPTPHHQGSAVGARLKRMYEASGGTKLPSLKQLLGRAVGVLWRQVHPPGGAPVGWPVECGLPGPHLPESEQRPEHVCVQKRVPIIGFFCFIAALKPPFIFYE